MSSFPPRCYYCDSKNFGSVDGYERRVVANYPRPTGLPWTRGYQVLPPGTQRMNYEREN